MKKFILIFFTTSFLYGTSTEISNYPIETLPSSISASQEISSLEMPSLLQRSTESSSITLPNSFMPVPLKKPWIAACLSIIPGLGHVYLDDPETASSFMWTTSVGLGLVLGKPIQHGPTLKTTAATVLNTSLYGFYAAYRDARLLNGSFQYSYKMPTDSLADLTFAPFRWSVIKKPQVWGGVLGFLAAGRALTYFISSNVVKMHIPPASTGMPPIAALPVGIGEEAFFRGFLQSALSEEFNPFTGTLVSSLVFGAAHMGNSKDWNYYAFGLPFIAAVGAYCGWLTHENRSLQESVALHTWYDFILFALGALGNEAMMTGQPGFAFSTSF